MRISNLEIDRLVVEGLATRKEDLVLWRSSLPPEVEERLWAVVTAPSWTETSRMPKPLSLKMERKKTGGALTGIPLILAIMGLFILVAGVVNGFANEDVEAFGWLFLVSILFFLASGIGHLLKMGGVSEALGLDDRDEFVFWQQVMAIGFIMSTVIPFIGLFFLGFYWALNTLESLVLHQDDSILSASIRVLFLGVIFASAFSLSRIILPAFRRFRGFLVVSVPPFFSSWLYDRKSHDEKSRRRSQETVVEIAVFNAPLACVAIVCYMLVLKIEAAKLFLEIFSGFDRKAIAVSKLVDLISSVGELPNTIGLTATFVGVSFIGLYTQKIAHFSFPTRSRRIILIIVLLSLVIFLSTFIVTRN